VVKRDLEHTSDFVVLVEVGNSEDGVLDALFRRKIEIVHTTIEGGGMTDSRGGRAVDAHLGEEGGEVSGLDRVALLTGETCGTEWVLDHHAPDGSEADPDMFTAEGCILDAFGNVGGLV
jgi:hypothetical protein